MKRVAQNLDREFGGVIPLIALLVVALFAFAGFAFDLGQTLKEQRDIHWAADAGAMAGVRMLQNNEASSLSDLRDKVMDVARENGLAENTELIKANDILVGTWSAGTFTSTGNIATANAVRVNATRNVPAIFSRVLEIVDFDPVVNSVALVNQTITTKCVKPFGLETGNFPSVDIPNASAFPITFSGGLQITVGKESPGNWGKIHILDAQQNAINMSAGPNFTDYMLGNQCGEVQQLPSQLDGATGSAAVKPVFDQLIGQEIITLVNSPYGNGKKPVTVYAYARVRVDSVSVKQGNNLDIGLTVWEIIDTPGTELTTGNPSRVLVY